MANASAHSVGLPTDSNPNIRQRIAATPDYDVWVAASAGSGKTKVLTDRVLRLLLPDPAGRWGGAAPHKILCITFTKAAAALMAIRVQNKLGEWAVMDEPALYEDLEKLLGEPPTENVLSAARKLFSTVLDVAGGLSIMTIHSFCQSTLGRFAIESGVTPGFTVLDESSANDMLRQIVDDFIRTIESGNNKALEPVFARIATYMDMDKLRETLLAAMSKTREVTEFLLSCGKQGIRDTIIEHLGYNPNLKAHDYMSQFLSEISNEDLLYVAKTLGTAADTYKKSGQKLAEWLVLSTAERGTNITMFRDALFTKEMGIRSIGKKLEASNPEVMEKISKAAELYLILQDNLAVLRQAEQTSDLMAIVDICLTRYTSRKKERNALDFNDLILKTRTLLESQNLEWVHYKMDEGIDHILVDEAQDTNAHQWEIIRRLSDEFLSGHGQDTRRRSLFVVGDEKQSIFSFHGADPEAFQTMRDFFAKRSEEANREFRPVSLETSFRSTRPVLQLVDSVFKNADLTSRLGLPSGQTLTHYSYRDKAAGLVELWDPIIHEKADNKNKPIQWELPPVSLDQMGRAQGQQAQTNTSPNTSPLAGKIAQTIWGWMESKEILKSEGRPIEPRDILVLVRSRTPFVGDLVRQLKLRGIPVSGVDRMKLTDQIAIMDCLALAKFAKYPEDDLSLACLLRSPFIRLSEDDLMQLALGRSGSLWDSLQATGSPVIVQWLRQAIYKARTSKPFDFFDDILNGVCPFDGQKSGWGAFATCLGADCIDPLDEFLSYCLSKEADGVFSVEELVVQIEKSELVIKRDTESNDKDSPNQVRIMTVHASKGLEAPIVFLPDTLSIPKKAKIGALQWIKAAGYTPDIPLWAASSGDGCNIYQGLKDAAYYSTMSEHLRLLYVALTRPQDRLYIMGETTSPNINELSWYHLVSTAFKALPDAKPVAAGLRIETEQVGDKEKKKQKADSKVIKTQLPDWVFATIEEDKIPLPITIQPSRLGGEDQDRALSPLGTATHHRFKRGNITHKLFQILPDIPLSNRRTAAENFLNRQGQDLSPEIRADILDETLKILNDPVFADVFGEDSLAEVPVSGDMGDGRMISGQIDRLVIGHKRIVIVDFKTNRPSPRDQNDIPLAYINQLKAYKTALSRIYPDREIVCALLWTDQPLLMPVSV